MEIKTLQATTYEQDGTTFVDVPWQVTEGETVLHEGRQTFPVTLGGDEVRAFLAQTLQTYKDEVAQAADQAQKEADANALAQTVSEVSNITVS